MCVCNHVVNPTFSNNLVHAIMSLIVCIAKKWVSHSLVLFTLTSSFHMKEGMLHNCIFQVHKV